MSNQLLKNQNTNTNKNQEIKNCNSYENCNSYIDDCSMSKYLAHEFLNPLSVISNCTELIDLCINGGNNYENLNFFVKIIKQQVKVCNDLSKFVLMDNSNSDKINITDFINNYIDILNNKNITIKIHNKLISSSSSSNDKINSPCILLNKNRVYLKVIFDNIFKNILKYSNDIKIVVEKVDNNFINIRLLNNIFKSNNIDNFIKFNRKMKMINRFTINENKSHFIGLELINKFCNILNIEWNLYHHDNDLYEYNLKIPINNQ